MRSIHYTFLGLPLLLALSACSHIVYVETQAGEFRGSLDVRWVKPDKFLYIPNKDDPLRFITSKRTFQAEKMYTDGGSIPRLFWSVPGYSPWGYGPAYIIHDWLFEAHYCDLPDYRDISFQDSARLLAEGIKTLMEANVAPLDETTMWAIYEAVRSPIARDVWDKPNSCDRPPEALLAPDRAPPGELLFRIDMNDRKVRSR